MPVVQPGQGKVEDVPRVNRRRPLGSVLGGVGIPGSFGVVGEEGRPFLHSHSQRVHRRLIVVDLVSCHVPRRPRFPGQGQRPISRRHRKVGRWRHRRIAVGQQQPRLIVHQSLAAVVEPIVDLFHDDRFDPCAPVNVFGVQVGAGLVGVDHQFVAIIVVSPPVAIQIVAQGKGWLAGRHVDPGRQTALVRPVVNDGVVPQGGGSAATVPHPGPPHAHCPLPPVAHHRVPPEQVAPVVVDPRAFYHPADGQVAGHSVLLEQPAGGEPHPTPLHRVRRRRFAVAHLVPAEVSTPRQIDTPPIDVVIRLSSAAHHLVIAQGGIVRIDASTMYIGLVPAVAGGGSGVGVHGVAADRPAADVDATASGIRRPVGVGGLSQVAANGVAARRRIGHIEAAAVGIRRVIIVVVGSERLVVADGVVRHRPPIGKDTTAKGGGVPVAGVVDRPGDVAADGVVLHQRPVGADATPVSVGIIVGATRLVGLGFVAGDGVAHHLGHVVSKDAAAIGVDVTVGASHPREVAADGVVLHLGTAPGGVDAAAVGIVHRLDGIGSDRVSADGRATGRVDAATIPVVAAGDGVIPGRIVRDQCRPIHVDAAPLLDSGVVVHAVALDARVGPVETVDAPPCVIA